MNEYAGYAYKKVVKVGFDKETKEDIYGVIDVRFPNMGIPNSWGTKKHAERYYAECVLFVPYYEYKKTKKIGYIGAYKAKGE